MDNIRDRNQIANLILVGPTGEDLHIVTSITIPVTIDGKKGKYITFRVANPDNTEQYQISIQIKEV
jgi:archaellum component FlaG (FlaF/FlaG flagellin family)